MKILRALAYADIAALLTTCPSLSKSWLRPCVRLNISGEPLPGMPPDARGK